MAGGNFMHRVISYVVNEVVVNGLANSFAQRAVNLVTKSFYNRLLGLTSLFLNSLLPEAKMTRCFQVIVPAVVSLHGWKLEKISTPAFQRFAVRTSRKFEDISNIAAKKRQEVAEQLKDISKNMDSFKNQ